MDFFKKMENIWYYYKWYILAAILILIMAGNYFTEKTRFMEPDCQVGIVTEKYIPETIREELEKKIEIVWGDTNGDGQSCAAVFLYQYDADTKAASEANRFMASAVQLAADIENKSSVWYLTDMPMLLTEADQELTVGKKWKDSAMLMEIEDDLLKEYYILERTPQGKDLSQKFFDGIA